MGLIRKGRVKKVILEFEDGGIEQHVLVDRPGLYDLRTNEFTESDHRKDKWLEHTVFWTEQKDEEGKEEEDGK